MLENSGVEPFRINRADKFIAGKMIEVNANDILIRARKLAASGQLEAARNLAGNACDKDKNNVENWLLLANLNGQLQMFNDAIECFSRAADLAPLDARTYAGLANAFHAAGRLEDALTAWRKALELQPENPDYWYMLATIYGMMENHEDSVACLRKVTELVPTHALAHRSIGYMLQVQKRLEEALESYKRAVECKPDYAETYNDIGVIMQAQGRVQEAIKHYRTALEIRPDYIDVMINLGGLLLTQNNPGDALLQFESALAIDRDNLTALCALGSAQTECGNIDEAYEIFNKVLAIDPAHEEATVKIARLHERQGNHAEALALLQPLLDRGNNADAATAFAILSPAFNLEDKAIATLEQALKNEALLSTQKTEMHFSLGKLYDKQGNYDLAYQNFKSGNELKPVDFNLQDQVRFFDSIINAYSEENLPELVHGSPSVRQPVFIVGMPRSGTSLTEQILSVHPQVQACGELFTIHHFAAQLHGTLRTGKPYPEGALHLARENVDNFSRDYLAGLPAQGNDKPLFTDKLPHNFLYLGLIQQIFPNARVIHCTRDARDTCFSCYSQDFSGGHPYAYDLESLGEYYLQYRRLMKHWQNVLNIPIYNLDYEKLVSDQVNEVRRLLKFCGLHWDDRCLDFHASGRFVLTSSYDQVRRPIYSSSIGRWKHYEKHIRPLLDILKHAK